MSSAIIIKIAVLVAMLVAVVIRSVRRRARMRAATADLAESAEIMRRLRLQALQDVPDDLEGSVKPDEPLAIMMEIGVPDGAASVFATVHGDASIYTTSGAGLLGGVAHENVKRAAIRFINEANQHRSQLRPTSDLSYPKDGTVRFFVRTRRELYVTPDRAEELLGDKTDPLWPLFYAGQELIAQFRLIAPGFGR